MNFSYRSKNPSNVIKTQSEWLVYVQYTQFLMMQYPNTRFWIRKISRETDRLLQSIFSYDTYMHCFKTAMLETLFDKFDQSDYCQMEADNLYILDNPISSQHEKNTPMITMTFQYTSNYNSINLPNFSPVLHFIKKPVIWFSATSTCFYMKCINLLKFLIKLIVIFLKILL